MIRITQLKLPINHTKEQLEKKIRYFMSKGIVYEEGKHLIVLFAGESVNDISQKLYDVCQNNSDVYVGIGTTVSQLTDIHRSYETAFTAYQLTKTALPKNFGYNMSIMILVYVVLGGIGSIRGSMISTVILYLLPELLRGLNNYRMLIYAIVLILAMLFNSAPQFITLRKRIFGGLKPQHAAHSGKEEA